MADSPLFEYLYSRSPKQLRHYENTTELQGLLGDIAELVYPLFILIWAFIERQDQIRYYVCNDTWMSKIPTCLLFFAQQRSLFNILKNVFRLTRILRTHRPWESDFGLTTQLWINFILGGVSNLLAFVPVLTVPGFWIDFGDLCHLEPS